MANPFKDIFKRKYTPYYSVEGVDDATKQQIREFGQQLQQDPTRFTEEQAKNITTLNNRLDNPIDPDLRIYESIQEGKSGRGAFEQRKTLEERRLMATKSALAKQKPRTEDLIAGLQGISEPQPTEEPVNTLTNVQSVIDQDDSAKALENKINQEKEDKRQKYTELIGIDPYKNSRAAFDKWMSDNPELVDKVLASSPKIKEDGSEAYVELLRKFQDSTAKGTLEKDFYGERPKEDKIRAEKNKRQLEQMPLSQQTLRPIPDELSETRNQEIEIRNQEIKTSNEKITSIEKIEEDNKKITKVIADTTVKYEGIQKAANLYNENPEKYPQYKTASILASLNNLGAIKYGNRPAKFGAVDSGIPASDGGTWAKFNSIEEAEEANRQIISEMYNIDADGNLQRFIVNYIIGPNATKEQIIEKKPEIKSRLEEITTLIGEIESEDNTVENYMGFWEALTSINPVDLAPFVKDAKLIKEYTNIGLLIKKDMDAQKGLGPELTDEEIKTLEDFVEYESRPRTMGASIVEGIAETLPFMQELGIAAVGGAGAIGAGAYVTKKTAQYATYLGLRKTALEWAKNKLKTKAVKKGAQITATVGTKVVALSELGPGQEAKYLKLIMPGIQITDEGARIYTKGKDEKTARRQARADEWNERTWELLGTKILKAFNFITVKPIQAAYNKLPKDAKVVVQVESTANSLIKAIKSKSPDIKIDQKTAEGIKKFLYITGYNGFNAEFAEERASEATKVFLNKLSEAGIVEGFDEDFARGLYTDFIKSGNWEQFKRDQIVEAAVLLIPGASARLAGTGITLANDAIESKKQKRFEESFPDAANKLKEVAEKNKENSEEYNTLVNKKRKLGKKQEERFAKLSNDIRMEQALEGLQEIIKKSPNLAENLDINIVDELVTITKEELEAEGKTLESQGLSEDIPVGVVLGSNYKQRVKGNLRFVININRGADFDTSLEEFFETVYKGGLSEQELESYKEYYNTYQSNLEARKEINEEINKRIPENKKIDPNSKLSIEELFSNEAKAKYYQDTVIEPKSLVQRIYQNLKNRVNRIFGNITLTDEVQEIYRRAGAKGIKLTDKEAKQEPIVEEPVVDRPVAEEQVVEEKVEEPKQEPKKRTTLRKGIEPSPDEAATLKEEDLIKKGVKPSQVPVDYKDLEESNKTYQIISADQSKKNVGTYFIAGDGANLNLKGEQEDFGIRYPRTYKGWAVTQGPATKILNRISEGNNIIAITTLTNAANAMKKNPTFIAAIERAIKKKVGVKKFNQLYRKNNKNIHKTAVAAKVNLQQLGREVAVPDFNQIAGKVVAVAEVEDVRTGEDRKVKHPAYDHEINFKSYRELKEPIPLNELMVELPEGDKRIKSSFLMAKTYNLILNNKESSISSKFKEFLETGDNNIFGVKTTGIQVASPQIKDISLDEAIQGIKSKTLIDYHRFVADLEVEQGLKSTTKASLGEWETGAEPSVYTEITSKIDSEQLDYIAAIKGLSRKQLTILNFEVNENGYDSMYEIEFNKDLKNIKQFLKMISDGGIEFKTIPVTGNKINLIVVDEGTKLLDSIRNFKEVAYEKEIKQRVGNARFIGSFESREKADQKYINIIQKYEQKNPERYSKVLRDNISNLRPRFDKNKLPKKQKVSYQIVSPSQSKDVYDAVNRKTKSGRRPKDARIGTIGSTVIPISTLLKRIDPKIYSRLLKHQFNTNAKITEAQKFVLKLEKFIRQLDSNDQTRFKLAMHNSDVGTMQLLAQKTKNAEDFLQNIEDIRGILDSLREELIELGEEIGYIEGYFPRAVTNYDDLTTMLFGEEKVKTYIEKQIAAKEKKDNVKLDDSDKAQVINQLFKGYSYIKGKPSFTKPRVFDTITADMYNYYEDAVVQLNRHIELAIERIENKKFFGAGELNDESIGDFIIKVSEGKDLSRDEVNDLVRILSAYFNFKPTNSAWSSFKTGTYGLLLGKLTNVVTQMQDIVYSVYDNGLDQRDTIKNIARYLTGRERITREIIGVENPAFEIKNRNKEWYAKLMNNVTNTIFTFSGFKLMDGLGKSVLINSAIQRYKRKAKNNRLSKKDKDYLKTLFGDSYSEIISDLKKDVTPNNYTTNELFLAYAALLKYQPVGRTEVPLKYLESGSVGRTMYMLKTFSIKQLNVLRDDFLDVVFEPGQKRSVFKGRNPLNKNTTNKEKAQAAANMLYLVSLIALAGAGADEIKDWLKNKESTFGEKFYDNLLKIILLNKYWINKVKRDAVYEGEFTAIQENVYELIFSFPPIDVMAFFYDSFTELIDKAKGEQERKTKVTRMVPFIGDVLYGRRDLLEFTGATEGAVGEIRKAIKNISGRGADDFTYYKIRELYKKSNEVTDLEGREIKIYERLLLDLLNNPQYVYRKDRNKDTKSLVLRLKPDKYRTHLRQKYGIQIILKDGKYEKLN